MNALERAKTHSQYLALSDSERKRVDVFNATKTDNGGIPCDICGGRRWVYVTDTIILWCDCAAKHRNAKIMEASGLTESLKALSFANFQANKPWQTEVKRAAQRYALGPQSNWFYIGGQVGSGKTHLCTAILSELIDKGRRARYMVWPDEVDSIKGNAEDYSSALDRLMDIEVLYIDDFLKAPKEQKTYPDGRTELIKRPPTTGELNAAFKLLNFRYNRSDKLTIFSSEFYLDDIMKYDAGLGSRIYQRCKDFRYEIGNDDGKNYRMEGT